MPRRVAVFDTNVYYELTADAAVNLKASERRAGVVALASAWVVFELLTHLADEEDPKFWRCWSGLRSLRTHVMLWNGAPYIPFIGSPRDALSAELFGWRDPTLRVLSDGLGTAVLRATPDNDPREVDFRDFCIEVKQFTEAQELRFGSGLRGVVETLGTLTDDQGQPLNEGGRARAHSAFHREHGETYAAEIIAMAVAARAGRSLSVDERTRCAHRVREVIPVTVHLLMNELQRFAGDGADPTKDGNSNTVWDLEIASLACRGAHLAVSRLFGSATPIVVTQERRIRRAAESAGAADLVSDRVTYESRLVNEDL